MLSVYAGPPMSGKTYLANMFAKNYVESGQNVLFVKNQETRETYGPFVDQYRGPLLEVVSVEGLWPLLHTRIEENRVGVVIIDSMNWAGVGTFTQNRAQIHATMGVLHRASAFGRVNIFTQTVRGTEEIAGPLALSHFANDIYTLHVQGPEDAMEIVTTCTKSRDGNGLETRTIWPVDIRNFGRPIEPPLRGVPQWTKMKMLLLDIEWPHSST